MPLSMTTERVAAAKLPAMSAEVFVVPLDNNDEYLVYAPLRQAAFIANAALVNQIAAIQAGDEEKIKTLEPSVTEFLRAMEMVDAGTETLPITEFKGVPEPTAVTLFLTTRCNLRCTYCYASAGDTPARSMTLDVAQRGIDFVAANAKKLGQPGFEVAYHGGGEPTVNWQVLTTSYDYAKRKGAELELDLKAYSATNGVLSDRKIDWVIEHLDGCSLSFDGLPGINDALRITPAGEGSSQHIMHTASRFDDAGFSYGLRLTVTRDYIRYLPQSIEFIVERFKPQQIQVEPAYQLGRWQDKPSSETEEFIQQYRIASDIATQHGQHLNFSAARIGLLTNHFCGVTRDAFALSPDGNVSACYEVFSEDQENADTFFYGKETADGYQFDMPRLDQLRHQAVQNREYCTDCFAKWTCAGDCLHKSVSESGEIAFGGSDRCHITRSLTIDQILDRIKQSGGLFWHQPPN